MVRTLSRLNFPLVSTVYVRLVPDGIGPPAPVATLFTPSTCGSADSSTLLSASSAIAATPWLAISPTLHTSARLEWTTKSGGESGCDPGAPGPGGVRFWIVTRQCFVLPPSSSSSSDPEAGPITSAPASSAPRARNRNRFIASPSLDCARDARSSSLRPVYGGLKGVLSRLRQLGAAVCDLDEAVALEGGDCLAVEL